MSWSNTKRTSESPFRGGVKPQPAASWISLYDFLTIALVAAALLILGAVAYVGYEAWRTSGVEVNRNSDDVVVNELSFQPSPTYMSEPEEERAIELPSTPVSATAIPTPTPVLISAKPLLSDAKPRVAWTATPLPTNTPTPSPTPAPTFVVDGASSANTLPVGVALNEKWIDVDLGLQTLKAYEGRIPVFESLVSTGTANHPTVTGQFRIWLRFQSQDMDGYRLGFNYYLRGVPYVQYFYQDYALHGTYWHNNFGTPMSHGCVNLPTPAAEWLFWWADYGTLVNIHL